MCLVFKSYVLGDTRQKAMLFRVIVRELEETTHKAINFSLVIRIIHKGYVLQDTIHKVIS